MDSESEQGKRFRKSAIHYLENYYGKIDIKDVKYGR